MRFSTGTSWDEAPGHSYCSYFGSLLLKTIRDYPPVSHSTEGTKYLQSRIGQSMSIASFTVLLFTVLL